MKTPIAPGLPLALLTVLFLPARPVLPQGPPEEPPAGLLRLAGRPLLEAVPPLAPAAGPWWVEGGALYNRERVSVDQIVLLPEPVPQGDLLLEAELRILEGDVAGVIFDASEPGSPCYAALLAAEARRLRLAALPWPGRDLLQVPCALEHGKTYRLSVRRRQVEGGVQLELLLDGALQAVFLDQQHRLQGRRLGLIANNSRACFERVGAYALADGVRGEPLLVEEFDALPPDAVPGFVPLQVREANQSLILSATLPRTGSGLGALARLVHAVQPSERHWLPHLSPEEGHVIGDHSFRSPAFLFAGGGVALALIPDLDDLDRLQRAGFNVWADYLYAERALTIAVGACRTAEIHVSYRPASVAYANQRVELRLHTLASREPGHVANPWGLAAAELWRRWGRPGLAAGGAQRAPLEVYAGHVLRWAFTPEPDGWGDTLWQEFTIGATPVGAPVFIVDVAQHPSLPLAERRWREPRSVWNQAWFSTQRVANGFLQYARLTGNEDLARRARLMTRFTLAAPVEDGLFPALYTTHAGGPRRYVPYPDTPGWEKGRWSNSNRRPGSVSEAAIHILDAAFTARLLLEWHGMEPDAAIPPRLFSLAARLLRLQRPSGAYPGWVEPDGSEPGPLDEGPESAMSAAFLLELASAFPDHRQKAAWLDSAGKALLYLEADPVARSRWEDFETYYSCSRHGTPGIPFERNGLFKQNTFSPFWCAEAFLVGHRALGGSRWLALGRRCLDDLSLHQQVWRPHYLPAETHGGFGVMTLDGEWNDARQSLFAPLYLDYYRETGLPEYFERGVAALRSSFAMLYCPENESVRAAYEARHPMFGPESYGFMMENIAHGGPGSNPIGTFTIFTWGNGAALASAGKILARYGQVYIDPARAQAFGIDGCTAAVAGDRVAIRDRFARSSLRVVYASGAEARAVLTGGAASVALKP